MRIDMSTINNQRKEAFEKISIKLFKINGFQLAFKNFRLNFGPFAKIYSMPKSRDQI